MASIGTNTILDILSFIQNPSGPNPFTANPAFRSPLTQPRATDRRLAEDPMSWMYGGAPPPQPNTTLSSSAAGGRGPAVAPGPGTGSMAGSMLGMSPLEISGLSDFASPTPTSVGGPGASGPGPRPAPPRGAGAARPSSAGPVAPSGSPGRGGGAAAPLPSASAPPSGGLPEFEFTPSSKEYDGLLFDDQEISDILVDLGAGLMAGSSPFFLQNVGTAAQQAVANSENRAARRETKENQEFMRQLATYQADLDRERLALDYAGFAAGREDAAAGLAMEQARLALYGQQIALQAASAAAAGDMRQLEMIAKQLEVQAAMMGLPDESGLTRAEKMEIYKETVAGTVKAAEANMAKPEDVAVMINGINQAFLDGSMFHGAAGAASPSTPSVGSLPFDLWGR